MVSKRRLREPAAACAERAGLDLSGAALDSTTSKLHKAAHGAKKSQAKGVSRGGWGTKVHAAVDALGHAVGLTLSPANW